MKQKEIRISKGRYRVISATMPLALALLGCLPAAAQSYNVALIPDSLKKDARAVVREDEETMEIKSPSKVLVKTRHVVTVFNENGDTQAGFSDNYNKWSSINSVTGILYDANGKEQRRIRKKDLDDRSAVGEASLMDDDRYKYHNFYCRNYPYTVEYQEEKEYNSVLYFDNWDPVSGPGVSTQHSKFVIIAPKDYEVRYKAVNCSIKPAIAESGDRKVYTWEIGNLMPFTTERFGPGLNEITPFVRMAPSDFEADGYKGNMSTWTSYGKFMNQLRSGRDVLPDNIRKKVHELTDTIRDERAKVYVLYNYMQQNTHYISIQLGIGGWQPFPADYVATKRYGDCKALSNYMIALLKEAGIKGKYVEIYGGRNPRPMMEDFPSLQSNHVIACVPMAKDTIWLECTSQTVSPGFMGGFTGNRSAVLIDEDGAHVVHTPSYAAHDNQEIQHVDGTLSPEGNLSVDVHTIYSGMQEEWAHDLIYYYSAEEREKALNEQFELPTYKVDKNHFEETKGVIPSVKEDLHISVSNYASVTGKRLFINPNVLNRSSTRLSTDSVRKYDIITSYSYRDVDSVTIAIPAGYQPESVPADIHIDSKFGKYFATVRVAGDKITYYRTREAMASRFPPKDYAEFVKFYDQLYKADHSRIVLVKQ